MKCELCDLEVNQITKHHLIPKQKGGKNKSKNYIWVDLPCSKQIHSLFTNSELKQKFNTLEKLKEDDRVINWIKWRQNHSSVLDIKYSQKKTK